MGGAPRIIRKIIKKDPPPPPASPIVERRTEVAKKTDAEGKTVTRRSNKTFIRSLKTKYLVQSTWYKDLDYA